MSVESGPTGYNSGQPDHSREAVDPTAVTRDVLMASQFGVAFQEAIALQQKDPTSTDFGETLATVPDILAQAIRKGGASEYTSILDAAAKTSEEASSRYWEFKGPQRAILEDGSMRMAAGVLYAVAQGYKEGSVKRRRREQAAQVLLTVMNIKHPVATAVLAKEGETYRAETAALQAASVVDTPALHRTMPGRRNTEPVQGEDAAWMLDVDMARRKTTAARVEISGIGSLLREVDGESRELDHPVIKRSAIGVITRALNSGALEETERQNAEDTKRVLADWFDDKSTILDIALSGHRRLLGATLRIYTHILDERENKLREFKQPFFRHAISLDRQEAQRLADIFSPRSTGEEAIPVGTQSVSEGDSLSPEEKKALDVVREKAFLGEVQVFPSHTVETSEDEFKFKPDEYSSSIPPLENGGFVVSDEEIQRFINTNNDDQKNAA